MRFLGFIAVLVTGGLLLSATSDFPDWGDPESPASAGEVSQHYILKTFEETAVPNMVTAVLADYRGYDTLFETVVIFTAGIAIIAILRTRESEGAAEPTHQSKADGEDLIVTTACRIVIPVIQLFALYVIAHGHHSPGGGFQGGVIFGASLIMLAISRNLRTALGRMPEKRMIALAVFGVLLYAGFGVACLLLGGNFLDYGVLAEWFKSSEEMARSYSMLGVEIGVAFTVATIMFAIYANLSTRGRLRGSL